MFNLERADKTVMNMFGLITAIKSSAENLTRASGGEGGEQIDRHIESVIELCDIATEKMTLIWQEISEIETESDQSKTIAEMISFLITDDSVPAKISDALGDAIADLSNPLSDDSPEAIAKVLEYHKDNE